MKARCITIPCTREIDGIGPCDYTIYGSKQRIYYLIWFINHRVTVRQLFMSKIYILKDKVIGIDL